HRFLGLKVSGKGEAPKRRAPNCQGNAPLQPPPNELRVRAFDDAAETKGRPPHMHALAKPDDAPHMPAMSGPVSHIVDGNRLTLLTEGPARMTALLELIASAQRSLRVL